MARGRFISNAVIEDREIHGLSSDTSRLAYIFLITLADREGRITGELGYLTSKLFPRRREITIDMVKDFIAEWANAGFVVWYEDENEKRALQLINFEKHQRGLRKDREPVSEYANPEDCRIIAGTLPDEEQEKPSKELKDKDKELLINNSNVNVNVNGDKKDGTNPAEIRQNDGIESAKSDYSEFQKVWEQETGRLIAGFTQFYRMCEDFVKVGVTPELYRTAIQEQSNSSYSVSNPTSVKNWAIGLLKKKDTGNKTQDATDLILQMVEEVWND